MPSLPPFTRFRPLAVVLLAISSAALAQVDSGAVRGTVTDPSGAVVANAKVTLSNQGTGLSTSTATAGDGGYTFDPVKIGAYTLTVEASGFRKATTHLSVHVQEQVRADFKLVTGTVTETVQVTGEAPELQTQDASVGAIATQTQINDLPLNGRNYTFLAQLSAGVTSLNPTRGLDLTGSFVANGLTTVHNSYLLDGIDNNNDTVDFLNGAAYANLPPPDALQEFKVQTSDFSAQFGRAGGAVVNAAIKSGTNQFHGTLWEFLRNDQLDAVDVNQYFTPVDQKKKAELRRNQFGGSFGGPIIKNKLFFFGDYEGTRIRTGTELTANVPTAAEAASAYTDFRDLFASTTTNYTDLLGRSFNGATILDPATTRAVTAGSVDPVTGLTATASGYVRDPFYSNGSIAGITNFATPAQQRFLNQLPTGRLDANAVKLLQLYPAANAPGFLNNFFVNRSQPDNNDHFDIRVDNDLSTRDQMFGRVSYNRRRAFFPGAISGLGSNIGFGQGNFDDDSINVAGSETHTFSSTMINEARFGYSRLRTTSQPPNSTIKGIPQQFGISGIPQGNGNGGLPTIDISGLTSLGAGAFASPNSRSSDTVQATENLTKVYGGHSFKGGIEYQRLHFPWVDPAWSRGEFSFGGFSGIPNVSGTGVGMADLLLTPAAATVPNGVNNVGGANSVFASNITTPDDFRNYWGAYFQDDWKATPKLTLNLGLRWELFGGMEEGGGTEAGLVPGALNGAGAQYEILAQAKNTPVSPAFTALLAKDGIQLNYIGANSVFTTPRTNFAPRIGLAYQITPKLVARSAYGIFYGGFENLGGAPDPGYNYPFAVNLSFFANDNVHPLLYPNGQPATLENGLTAANPDPTSPNFSPAGLSLVGFQTPWKTAYTQEWNGSLQYQLSQSQSVTVAYVGNNSHHLLNGEKRNIPFMILPPGAPTSQYVPFPDFGLNSDYLAADGAAYYHSLQLTFDRRFSRGFNALLDYTRSVCMSDYRNILNIADANFNRAPTLPGFGITKDYAYCGNNVPNIFHASGIWELPLGRGKRFGSGMSGVLNAVVGGWSTQWIFTLQDGFPFAVPCPVSTTASNDFRCYATLAPGMDPYAHQGPHGTTQFLNPAAFVQPPLATAIGQTDLAPLGGPPNQVSGPGYDDLDFSLFKNFQTTEKTNLEFRAEFFNFLNHPNFGSSSNSFASLNFTNTSFGQITGTRGIGREVQLALKFYF